MRYPYRDGWTVDDFPFAYAPSIGATVIDENAIRVRLAARATEPSAVPNLLTVKNPLCSEPLLVLTRIDHDPPAPSIDACGSLVLSFAPSDRAQEWHLANPDSAAYAESVLRSALAAAGIDLTVPGPQAISNPGFHVVWQKESPELREVVRRCWYPSDNLIAEMLLQEAAGVAYEHRPLSDPEQRRTSMYAVFPARAPDFRDELAWAKAKPGLALTDDRVADGSGMSQYDRLTANELAAILAYDWKSPNRDVVLDALPVAGVSGTLESQYVGTPIAGRAFAKSGSMLHASNLAGYLATKNHGTVIFAFMVDDWVGDDDDLLPLRGAILGRFVDAP